MSFPTSSIQFTDEFSAAFDLLEEQSHSVFLHGQAGSGKSTLLEWFRSHTTKKHVILAPTGVAALTVRGETIHSFFGFKPSITPHDAAQKGLRGTKKKYRVLDCIVIDEISMVRADLLDCIDQFLQSVCETTLPFGGKQMIFIGDLYQLPPVVKKEDRPILFSRYKTPYFFSAHAMRHLYENLKFIELTHVFRQSDHDFISTLQDIRNKTISFENLQLLNEQCLNHHPSDQAINLVPTNAEADRINTDRLIDLPSPSITFSSSSEGDIQNLPTPTASTLSLKEGARVMLLNNDVKGSWINGSLATVVQLTEHDITIQKDDGTTHSLYKHRWSYYKYVFNEEKQILEQEEVGAFIQFPLRLAWAITIHKSQGLTYDELVLNPSTGLFAHGQCYVALSRCRSLEGLTFKAPLRQRDIILDKTVQHFLEVIKRHDNAF